MVRLTELMMLRAQLCVRMSEIPVSTGQLVKACLEDYLKLFHCVLDRCGGLVSRFRVRFDDDSSCCGRWS